MKELVEFLWASSSTIPTPSMSTESDDDRGSATREVAPGDMGKVIGRGGRTAKAIRTVVRAAAARSAPAVHVDFVD